MMTARKRLRLPLTYKRAHPWLVETFPSLPASAHWKVESRPWQKRLAFLGLAVGAHFILLGLLKDVPVYRTLVTEERVAGAATLITEFHSEVVPASNGTTNIEQRFTVSTRFTETPASLTRPASWQPPGLGSEQLPDLFGSPADSRADVLGEKSVKLSQAPRVSMFGLIVPGKKVVYLLDASGSMYRPLSGRDPRARIMIASEEIRRSILALPEHVMFNVILVANTADHFEAKLVAASSDNKARAIAFLAQPSSQKGETHLEDGLTQAIALEPDSIFLLTDGITNGPDWSLLAQVRTAQNKRPTPARLYAFGMKTEKTIDGDRLLRQITREYGGAYVPYLQWSRELSLN
jgi:hypothetical protein